MNSQKPQDHKSMSIWHRRWRGFISLMAISVLAACGGGGGTASGSVGNTAPSQVALAEVSSAGSSSIDVSWLPAKDSVTAPDQIKYQVHASTDATYVPANSTLKVEGIGLSSARLTGLQPATRYTIMLVAINAAGLSTASSTLEVTTSAINSETIPGIVVAAPTDSQVVAVTGSQVTLTANATTPKLGQFIASTVGDGLLRQVSQVSTVAGQTVVQTQSASLNQVVNNVEFSSAFVLSSVPTEVTATQAGILVAPSTTQAGATEIRWPQTNFRLSSVPVKRNTGNTTASHQVGVTGAENFDVSTTKVSKVGNWATFLGPNTIGILTGTTGLATLNLDVTKDDSKFITDARIPIAICKVEVISTDAPGLLTVGSMTATGTELVDGYNAIRHATQDVSLNANGVAPRAEPYLVVLRAYIDESGNHCQDQYRLLLGWKERLDIGINVVVVSTPNFPQSETKALKFNGDFSVDNNVTFTFDPRFEAEVKLHNFCIVVPALDYARMEVKGRAELAQKLTVTATSAGVIDETQPLIDTRKFVKVYMAGTVPIVMSGEFSADLRVNGNVTGAMIATEDVKFSLEDITYGVVYDGMTSPQWQTTSHTRPTYELKLSGNADAQATLTLSLVPRLAIKFYEAATGRLVISPYVQADAGLHGQVLADITPATTTTDADYWLTKGQLSGGVKAFVMADLSVLDYSFVKWPSSANITDYTSFYPIEILANKPIAGIPTLTVSQDQNAKHPTDSRAILFKGRAVDIANPFQALFGGPDSFLPFATWTAPKVIAANSDGYTFIPAPVGSDPGDVWIAFTKAGTYTVRLGGNSSMGGWARQVAEMQFTVADANANGIPDWWEEHYGLTGSGSAIANADTDGDGRSNLAEWQDHTNPTVIDGAPPTGGPTQTAVITAVNDNVAPSTGPVSNGGSTDDTTPTLSGTLSAPLTATQVLRVYDGTTLLGGATVTAQTWVYTPAAQAVGSHIYKVVVSAVDGVEGTSSSTYSISIGPDGGATVPSLTNITPTTATVSTANTFTVTGQNLPLTAVMSLEEGACQTPTNRAATGFTVVCTPGSVVGSKVVTISAAFGGTVIDATRSVTVSAVAPPPSTLTPAVTGVNPTAMVANGIAQTLTIIGSGFTSGNIVQFQWGVGTGAGVWNNSANPISSLTASQIRVPMNPGTVTDMIYVRVCVSSSQTSTIDCSSGTTAISVSPVVSGSPDLVVQSVSFGPSAVQPGATVQVLFAVKNQGTGTAGASTAAIRINQSGTSSAGTTAGTASVQTLTAGASTAVQSINVVAPTTPGPYSVWVVADSGATAGQISSATANDSLLASAPLTVNSITTGPVVSSVTSSPQTLVAGGPAAFSINGTELQPGYLFSLAGCNATEVGSASTTLRQFTCTLTQAGTNLAGSVSTASGTVLWTFSQSVAANPVASGPGGLYVGYYAEDPATNPEDPTIGGLFFSLPATNGNFAGAMFFTFAGCQTSNVGALSGTKDASGMIGAWSGVVDGILQSGSYGGAYGSALGAYSGTYTVSGGKQLVSVPGCIQYYVSPQGTWEAMPVGSSVPSTFTLAVSGTSVSWINPVGTIITWVSVIDAAEASAGIATAVKYQTGSAGGAPTFNLGAVSGLTSGRTYVVTVTTATSNSQRTGAASVQVVR